MSVWGSTIRHSEAEELQKSNTNENVTNIKLSSSYFILFISLNDLPKHCPNPS